MGLQITGVPPAGKVGASYEFAPAVLSSGSPLALARFGTSPRSVSEPPDFVPPRFSLSPAAPAGLMFDASTGGLTGTPKAAGTTTLTLKAHRDLWAGGQYLGPDDGSITFDLTITN